MSEQSKAPKARIARALSTTPGGAGLFTYVNTETTEDDAFLLVTASNLERLRDKLEADLKTEQANFAQLLQLQQDVAAVRRLLGL